MKKVCSVGVWTCFLLSPACHTLLVLLHLSTFSTSELFYCPVIFHTDLPSASGAHRRAAVQMLSLRSAVRPEICTDDPRAASPHWIRPVRLHIWAMLPHFSWRWGSSYAQAHPLWPPPFHLRDVWTRIPPKTFANGRSQAENMTGCIVDDLQ